MGDPRRLRKSYHSPLKPWVRATLAEEKGYMTKYGLKNKRELWRTKSILGRSRTKARNLIGQSEEKRARDAGVLMGKLIRWGVLAEGASLDDVLGLKVEDVLSRRLQTVVFRKGMASTIDQARQFVVHGHVRIGENKVTKPGYIVTTTDEAMVVFNPQSQISNISHPIRSTGALATDVAAAKADVAAKVEGGKK